MSRRTKDKSTEQAPEQAVNDELVHPKESPVDCRATDRAKFVKLETVRIYRLRVGSADTLHTQASPSVVFGRCWQEAETAANLMADKLGF